MGYSRYDKDAREERAKKEGWADKSREQNFTQRSLHPDMNPRGVEYRECRDSENHPFSLPVQIWLDVTGSMGEIPQQLIVEGLPKMISNLLNKGIKSPSLMFGAVGDHECDNAPLQVSQFESGDEELDMWLSRTFIEMGGGGNGGESYGLAWYFAANHVRSDAWEKRNQKGYVFTIGDEPNLDSYPKNYGSYNRGLGPIMGSAYKGSNTGYSDVELLRLAQEKNHVYHIFLNQHGRSYWIDDWRRLMGSNLLVVNSHKEIPDLIYKTILSNEGKLQKAEGVAHLAKLEKTKPSKYKEEEEDYSELLKDILL